MSAGLSHLDPAEYLLALLATHLCYIEISVQDYARQMIRPIVGTYGTHNLDRQTMQEVFEI